jgi:tight adherence protein C
MSLTTILAGLLLLVALGIGIYLALRQPGEDELLRQRMLEWGDRETPATLEEIELSLSFAQRVLVPIVQKGAGLVTRLTPANMLEATHHKLEVAGRPGRLGAPEFIAIRFIAAAVLGGLTFFLFLRASGRAARFRFLFPPLMTVFGFFLPVIWLGSKTSSRQDDIVKALPDALDLLTVCVEAGLGFDAAMAKLTEKWDDELALEFGRVLQEIQLGKLRRVALRDMSDRMEVPDVTTFVAAVVQAEQLGVSMAKVLRIQSDQMRMKRRQRAEEKAHQAGIKMLIPMVVFIIPSLFIILLGPAVLIFMESGIF